MKISEKNTAVIGQSFGDESKAAISFRISGQHDYVVKFNGSLNAGHTIYHKGQKIVRRQIPSANFSLGTKAFIGSNALVDFDELIKEIENNEKFFTGCSKLITVDPDAFLILPKHIEEDQANIKVIGSTGKGVGPAMKDRIGRSGMRIKQLIKNNDPRVKHLQNMGVQFKHILEMKPIFSNSKLLFEGSQSTLLDINIGIYPFVSCSDTTLSGIMANGFEFAMPGRVIGVSKAYSTKVGTGPYPTEATPEEATILREKGNEFGSVTGRPRRCGWLDLPSLRYSVERTGVTELAIAKLDILNGMESFKICTRYEGGDPVCPSDFEDARPIYFDYKGWGDIRNERGNINAFVNFIQDHCHVPVRFLSYGVGEYDILEL